MLIKCSGVCPARDQWTIGFVYLPSGVTLGVPLHYRTWSLAELQQQQQQQQVWSVGPRCSQQNNLLFNVAIDFLVSVSAYM